MQGACTSFDPNEHQHIRYNPLKDEWVLVSPHRMKRPWSGQTEDANATEIPEFDPTNPLCPLGIRANGVQTPDYRSTHVFPNDFPALLESGPEPPASDDDLFQCKAAQGSCQVMCFHPKSNVHFASMTIAEIQCIINEWIQQTRIQGAKYKWVQIFENRGAAMGCSNPHPHCQIWSSSFLPNEARIKDETQRKYFLKHGKALLQDYLQKELVRAERVVINSSHWVVIVPYWAVYPFETLVVPKRQIQRFVDTLPDEIEDLSCTIRTLVTKYDNLFKCSFPYSMGWHGAPTGSLSGDQPHWTFHGIYLPPLLRSATVKKFIVGYELLAQSQRDLTPEKAAQMLREQSMVHYTQEGNK